MSKDLEDGEVTQVQGHSGVYLLKREGNSYSCSCPAWRNQSEPIYRRTCKHLKAFRGEDAENKRIADALIAAGIDPATHVVTRKKKSTGEKATSKKSTGSKASKK